MSAASTQCLKFINDIEKRLAAGVEAAAQEFTDQMFAALDEVKAVLDPDGYKGSGPGDPPAVFKNWFTEHLDFKAEGFEAAVGFDHEHAAAVYRLLIEGTKHIEPRAGPEELYKEIKNIMVLSFNEGFCGTADLEEAPF